MLIEATVGHVKFDQMDDNWPAKLSLALFSYMLGVVVMNMVIARINSIYKTVLRKGTLFYYKELFDLRYVFCLDPQYGFLSSL